MKSLRTTAPTAVSVARFVPQGRTRLILSGFIAFAGLLMSTLSVDLPAQTGRQFFVAPAPTGKATNDGSVVNPLDLATALSSAKSPARPGDTIWMLGGTYSGNFTSSLTGSLTAPIIVRAYPGQRPTIDANTANRVDAALTVNGSDTWFWGFEVTDSTLQRLNSGGLNNPVIRQTSVNVFGPRTRFINMVVHDGQQGFGFWAPATDAVIHGTTIFNVGVEAPDRGHGHGIYVQNDGGANGVPCGTANAHCKKLTDNIILNGFSFGIHAYTEGGAIDNLDIQGNTLVNAGILSAVSGAKSDLLVGGLKVAHNTLVADNHTYYSPEYPSGRGMDIGYGTPCASPTVINNYLVALTGTAINLNCTNAVMTGNTVAGFVENALKATFPSNTYTTSRPSGIAAFVRPNVYEPGRGNVTIYNWDLRSQVSVDLAPLGLHEDDPFEIRDAQNFFAPPVVSGSYHAGVPVNFPMTGLTAADPVGNAPVRPGHTGTEFGIFVVLPVVSAGATIPAITLAVSPTLIPPGQSAQLSWSTSNATTVAIDQNIGSVPASGTVAVSPSATTTYTLTATGSGGITITTTATVTVSVDAPPVLPGADITLQGATPIALVTTPRGGGNKSLEVIRDGVFPAVGSANSSQQYDTYTGDAARSIDWVGYQYAAAHTFTGLTFQEGREFADGGWFTTRPSVQVRVGGVWIDAPNQASTPAYPGANGITFERFTFTFSPITGDAIRLAGTPGGSTPFITVGELRVNADDSAQPVSATMLAPNGGEVWAVGTAQTIRWLSSQVNTVTLEYRTSATAAWTLIAQNVAAASGSYAWTIPDTATTQARVRITSSAAATVSDTSDGDFTIVAPVVIGAPPQDITALATPIALITAPRGGGNKSLDVIRDGVFPAAGSTNSQQQYDTYLGDSSRTFDWIGYQFAAPHVFTGLVFQEGMQFSDGGWFTSLGVQIRINGVWTDAPNLTSTPVYGGANGVTFERYTLSFSPLSGDGIRIAGAPGGAARFITVAELRVMAAEPSSGGGSITVLAPNGGESWTVGTTQTIRWSSAQVSAVALEYRTSAAAAWTSIAQNVAAAGGSYSWSVPNTVTTQARVRVTDAANATVTDLSDADFTIAAPPATAPTATFTASPNPITVGLSTTLSWSTTNATTVSISPGVGAVAASGTQSVSPIVTTIYTLTASGPGGALTPALTTTVTVNPVVPVNPPPTATFTASPTPITVGQSSTLSWSTANATSVSISPGIGIVAGSGTQSVSPTATTVYTLSATGLGGALTPAATATVTVNPATVPGVQDITASGTPIALVTTPRGGGSQSLEVIRDGVFPAVGSTNSSQQYDTYTGDGARSIDWVGYQFAAPHTFTGMTFQEGRQFVDGGWFTAQPGVQVRVGGIWIDVANPNATPAYPGPNGITFERFAFTFNPITGDAIRLVGTPGGSTPFITVGELRVSADDSSQPVAVTMLAPNGGEVWAVGTSQTIRWTSSQVSTVTIEYRTSPAGAWALIAQGVAAPSGSYAWAVPDTATAQARVRITSSSAATITDTSDNDFTIVAPVVGGTPAQDITAQGTPIALITAPRGGGSQSLAVIRDGVFPAVGSTNSQQQYDTYLGDPARTFDWIGYQFAATHTFAGLIFQEGMQFPDGGWFTSFGVQVRINGVWTDVPNLVSAPTYPGPNGSGYERFTLTFSALVGDAIRIAGVPGGQNRFISVGELRVSGQ